MAGISAAIGAAAYGLLIRQLGFYGLPLAALAVIAAACALATCGAAFTLGHFHSLNRWWLTQSWWYAFSGGLCWSELRRHATTPRNNPA
jgi:hypothetical protein